MNASEDSLQSLWSATVLFAPQVLGTTNMLTTATATTADSHGNSVSSGDSEMGTSPTTAGTETSGETSSTSGGGKGKKVRRKSEPGTAKKKRKKKPRPSVPVVGEGGDGAGKE